MGMIQIYLLIAMLPMKDKMALAEELQKQIVIVIQLLQDKITDGNPKQIIYTLLDRYENAEYILKENDDIDKITILGGCRAYLDAYSDYMNPLLVEMDKAEKIVKSISCKNKF